MLHKQAAVVLMACAIMAGPTPAQDKEQTKPPKQRGKSPVKVFVLAGQSNMLGYGLASEKDKAGNELPGTLAWMLKDPIKAPFIKHLFDPQGAPFVREDVWVDNAGRWPTTNKGPLTLGYGCNENNFGPEVGFGLVMGDLFDNQVLIIKTGLGREKPLQRFSPAKFRRQSWGDLFANDRGRKGSARKSQ